MDDRNALADEIIENVLGGNGTLVIVAPADAEDVVPALFESIIGEVRIGRSRADLEDTAFVVNRRGGDRRRRAIVADNQRHFLGRQLIGNGHRLARIAGVVAHLQHQLAAKHAAGGVDVFHGLFGAAAQLIPIGGVLAGHGTDHGDRDILREAGACQAQACQRGEGQIPTESVHFCPCSDV